MPKVQVLNAPELRPAAPDQGADAALHLLRVAVATTRQRDRAVGVEIEPFGRD